MNILARMTAMKAAWLCVLCSLAGSLLLAGCAAPGAGQAPVATYDLGPVPDEIPTAATTAAARRLTVVLAEVQAPAWLDSRYITYRLGYADALQPRPYAQARWAMAPAQLLQQRARQRLARFANVLSVGDTSQELLLKLELDDYSQVFDSEQASRVQVRLRASLIANGRFLAQRSFAANRPAPTANAAGAVRGLAGATDALLDELARWVEASAAARPAR